MKHGVRLSRWGGREPREPIGTRLNRKNPLRIRNIPFNEKERTPHSLPQSSVSFQKRFLTFRTRQPPMGYRKAITRKLFYLLNIYILYIHSIVFFFHSFVYIYIVKYMLLLLFLFLRYTFIYIYFSASLFPLFFFFFVGDGFSRLAY